MVNEFAPGSGSRQKTLNKMASAGIFKCGERGLLFRRNSNLDPKLNITEVVQQAAGQRRTGDDTFLQTLKPIRLGDNQ
jgi:hypothetical protein